MPDRQEKLAIDCACGATLRYPASQAGRTGACPACGAELTAPPLETPEPPPDKPDDAPPAGAHARFFAGLGDALLLNRSTHNALMWAVLSGAFWLLDMAPDFGAWMLQGILFLLSVLLFASTCAFLLDTVAETIKGEDDLPDFGMYSDVFESIVRPLIEFIWVFVALIGPAFLWRFAAPHLGVADPWTRPVFLALLVGGALLVPAGLLVSSTAGVGYVFRIDLLLRAVLWTPLEYAVVCAFMGATGALFAVVVVSMLPDQIGEVFERMRAMFDPEWYWWTWAMRMAVLDPLFVYVAIVWMKAVGLWGRCFSHRFAW